MLLQRVHAWREQRYRRQHPELRRMIIEGGFQDDWRTHYFDLFEAEVPEGVTKIHLGMGSDLDLVARMQTSGILVIDATSTGARADLTLGKRGYNYFIRINRVCTAIIEDGRVYHDRGLIQTPLDFNDNSQRLADTLDSIRETGYSLPGDFDRLYADIQSKAFFEKKRAPTH